MNAPNLVFQYDFGTGFAVGNSPINASATQLELIWTSEFPSASVQAITYEFAGSIAQRIIQFKDDGLVGGIGIGEGIGVRIFDGTYMIFDGCLDVANLATLYECDVVKCPLKKAKNIDWLTTISYLSFAYLRSKGRITPSMYKKTPYTITSVPDMPQLIMLIGMDFVMVAQILKEVNDLISLGIMVSGSAITEVSTAGLTTADLTAEIAMCVTEVLYTGTLVFSTIKVTQQIFDQIIQKKKYKLCMRVEDLLNAICAELSLNLSSTIIQAGTYKDTTIMPQKILMPNSGNWVANLFKRPADETLNPNCYGHPDGNIADLFRALNTTFNAAPKVENGVLYYEEIHAYNKSALGFKLPNTGAPGYTYNLPDPYGTNIGELKSNYLVKFQLDTSELNTVHQYTGTTTEATIVPLTIHNKGNVLLQGLQQVEIPFALAKRKESLNFVEQILDALIQDVVNVVNAVIGIINSIINIIDNIISWFGGSSTTVPTVNTLPGNIISGRIGWMELSNDSFSVPKIFIGTNVGGDWEIHPNNVNDMSAIALLNNFHGKNLITRGNQWLTFKGRKFKICLSDFLLISGNNIFTTADGRIGKFEKLLYNISEGEATADYRINQKYTNNLSEHISIDGN